MPGGSSAPILVAFGAGSLFLGLVLGGIALWVGVDPARRDAACCGSARRSATTTTSTARSACRRSSTQGRRPASTCRARRSGRCSGALGSAALLGGLVVGGWVLDPRGRLPRVHADRLARRLHGRVPQGRGGRPDRPPREHPATAAARCGRSRSSRSCSPSSRSTRPASSRRLGDGRRPGRVAGRLGGSGRLRCDRARRPARCRWSRRTSPSTSTTLEVAAGKAVHDLLHERGPARRRRTTSSSGRRTAASSRSSQPTNGGSSTAYQYDAAAAGRLRLHLLDPPDPER